MCVCVSVGVSLGLPTILEQEADFVYACEMLLDITVASSKELDDLQLRVARYALGQPKTSSRLLTIAELGQIPLSWHLVYLALKSFCHAWVQPDHRPIKMAVMDSRSLHMTSTVNKSNCWYSRLIHKLGSYSILLEDIDSLSANQILEIPAKYLSSLLGNMRSKIDNEIYCSPRYRVLRLLNYNMSLSPSCLYVPSKKQV